MAESLAAVAEKTGWTLDYMTGGMSQGQLMLMLRGWSRIAERLREATGEDGEYEFPEPTPMEAGGPLDPGWMLQMAQERGFAVVNKD